MGANVIGGSAAATGGDIVFSSISSANTSGGVTQQVLRTRIVPKGVYNVSVNPLGDHVFNATSVAGYTASTANSSGYATIVAYDCETGRPMTTFRAHFGFTGDPVASLLHVPKDAFLTITLFDNVNLAPGNILYDVTLSPTNTPFNLEVSFTPSTGTTTSAVSSSTSLNLGAATLGWDYDSNEMALIWTGQSGTSGIGSGNSVQFSQFYLVRKGTNGVWDQKSFNVGQAAGMGGWYQYPSISEYNPTGGFYIKDNILHHFSPEGNLLDGSNRRWGWIKGSVAGASGSTVAFEPGHSTTGFADSTSSIASTTQGNMMYFYDSLNHKVCYFGYRTAANSANFVPKWFQYDIMTNTVEYSSTGSSQSGEIYTTGYGYVWDNFVCDIPNGWFGGIVSTSGSSPGSYFGKWPRASLSRNQLQVYSFPANGSGNNTTSIVTTQYGAARVIDSTTMATTNGTILTSYLNQNGGSTVYATHDFSSLFSRGGIAPFATVFQPIAQKVQMILNPNKIGIVRATVEKVFTTYPSFTSSAHTLIISMYSAPNTRAIRGLLTGNTGGVINYSITGGMGGSNFLSVQASGGY